MAFESGNQSGVQQSVLLTGLTAPVASSIRATDQPVSKLFATPLSHFPSGDQVICWKKPLRSRTPVTFLDSISTMTMPFAERHAIFLPSGDQDAQGYSPGAPSDTGFAPSAPAIISSPWRPCRLLS